MGGTYGKPDEVRVQKFAGITTAILNSSFDVLGDDMQAMVLRAATAYGHRQCIQPFLQQIIPDVHCFLTGGQTDENRLNRWMACTHF